MHLWESHNVLLGISYCSKYEFLKNKFNESPQKNPKKELHAPTKYLALQYVSETWKLV